MTIKPLGGVFGRNPTFNDVDAKSVTADQATVNGVLLADEVGINTSPSYPLHVVLDTAGFIAGFRNSDATILARTIVSGTSLGDLVTAILPNTGHAVIYSDSGKTLALGANGSTTAALTVNTDQTVSFRENLIIDNGKGIDFSATAGTGTSELLDDYEEGTWQPVYTSTTDAADNVNNSIVGYYTKVGNIVYATASLTGNDLSGITSTDQVRIDGLPFASSSTSSGNDQAVNVAQHRYLLTTDHTLLVPNATTYVAVTTDGFIGATYAAFFQYLNSTGTSLKISMVYQTQ